MNKKLYKITAIVMACALLLSICSFAVSDSDSTVWGRVEYSCNAGYTSSDASTSCANSNVVCVTNVYAYGEPLDNPTGECISESGHGEGYGSASASCSYARVLWLEARSDHSVPDWSGSLNESL